MLRLRSHTDPDKFLNRQIFHLSKPFMRNRANCALFSTQKLTRFLGSIPCKRKANPLKFLSVQDFPWTRVNHLCSHTLRLIKKSAVVKEHVATTVLSANVLYFLFSSYVCFTLKITQFAPYSTFG